MVKCLTRARQGRIRLQIPPDLLYKYKVPCLSNMHAQCCFLWYSQTRLWSPQCALKAADHLVRAFSSVSAHSKAFLSYTNYDSCGLNSQRRQNEFTGKLNRCKGQKEKAGKETTKWNLILWSQGRFLLSLIRVSKDWIKEKPPRKRFFHFSPASICLCTVESSWVHRHEDTNFIYTQSNKQSFCKIPLCLSFIKRHLFSISISWTGQQTV